MSPEGPPALPAGYPKKVPKKGSRKREIGPQKWGREGARGSLRTSREDARGAQEAILRTTPPQTLPRDPFGDKTRPKLDALVTEIQQNWAISGTKLNNKNKLAKPKETMQTYIQRLLVKTRARSFPASSPVLPCLCWQQLCRVRRCRAASRISEHKWQ